MGDVEVMSLGEELLLREGAFFEVRGPPTIRRGASAKASFLEFRFNARRKWRFQDVEYLRGTSRPGLFEQLLCVKSRVGGGSVMYVKGVTDHK